MRTDLSAKSVFKVGERYEVDSLVPPGKILFAGISTE